MKHNKWLKLLTISTWTILTVYLFIETTTKTYTEVLFSPDNHPQQKLLSLIKKTTSEINLAIYTFTNPILAKALVNAKDNGVNVEVVIDQNTLKTNKGQAYYLHKNNIPVYVYKPPSKGYSIMHHKFAIFNTIDGNKLSCTGSLNWTKSACQYNQENILITNDKSVYKQYKNWFEVLKLRCFIYAPE